MEGHSSSGSQCLQSDAWSDWPDSCLAQSSRITALRLAPVFQVARGLTLSVGSMLAKEEPVGVKIGSDADFALPFRAPNGLKCCVSLASGFSLPPGLPPSNVETLNGGSESVNSLSLG